MPAPDPCPICNQQWYCCGETMCPQPSAPPSPYAEDLRQIVREFGLEGAPQRELERYLEAEWRGGGAPVLRCDVALALLRLGRTEVAEKMLGVRVKRCPPAVPPWPPRPVARGPEEPRVTRKISPNPCAPGTGMHQRFGRVRVGMTIRRVRERGASARDVRYWIRKKWMEVSK